VPQIRWLVLDVDGVLTDGTVLLMESGDEVRGVHFHDLDAVASWRRRGLGVAILSGEDTPASRRIAARFGVTTATWGEKDKLAGLRALAERVGVALDEICYVGDSDREAPALAAAGLGLAPADATTRARAAAHEVLAVGGGRGAVAAAVELLEQTCDLPAVEASP
jgi:3-deoxy-D-manno-octulosonate 8-phosphate phosphatase (KDO 8-P phosphatase)